MPIVLGVEIGWVILVTAFGAFLLSVTAKLWLRPLVQALQHPHGAWWKRVLLKPVEAVARATLYVEKHVQLALSRFASGSLHLLTRWFNGMAVAVHWTYKELGLIAHDVSHALTILRVHTIPHLIHVAVSPVRRLAHSALTHALAAERFAHALEKRLLHGIDRLAHRLEHLVIPRLRAAERSIAGVITHDIPWLRRRERVLEDRLRGQAARLTRVEKALGLGVFAAVIFRVLARVAPWLFCRNWKRLGRQICGVNPLMLEEALLFMFAAEIIGDLPALVKIMQGITEETTREMKRLSGV